MQVVSHDVLLVGGGGAGLRAAIAVAEHNPGLRIGVLSKVYPMRSHTVSAEGGAAAVIGENDTLDDHAYDTISGGDWLCDQDAVEFFVEEAPRELLRMERWGCPWSRKTNGTIATRSFGGMKHDRTWFAADKTGFHLLHTLFQTTLSHPPIQRHDEWFATRLLVEGGRCHGVVAIELATGKVHAVLARAVVLCTGGAGSVFPFTTNANIKTGDGMGLAYRAGVPLKDMEFVQYHPTGLPFTGILITEAARAEGGWLVNEDGYRYLQDYDLGEPKDEPVRRSMELGPRDRLSQAFEGEREKGRTIEGPYGEVVHLDLRHLGEQVIDEKLPFVRELCRKYEKIDPVEELVQVRPVVHYMMGGIHVDMDGATPLAGLYAAGETACININGANRLGSNSLTALLVFGARAGRAAAEFAQGSSDPPRSVLAQALEEEERLHGGVLGRSTGGGERLASVREDLLGTMEERAGIFRDGAGLQAGLSQVEELRRRFAEIALDDRSLTFKTELTHYLELENLLDVGETILRSALERTESRGAHQRTDHSERNDDDFLTHSLCYREEDGSSRVEFEPVTITRWPPEERHYGE